MKRSEVIEYIEEVLSQIAYAESCNEKKYEDEYIANRILMKLEEIGYGNNIDNEKEKEME